ncbi:amino acid/amide ABC transporter membrane protein 1, HAAT family [Rhizobiales bacterium GAS188]|nr:amino acid/amide ABC transporter membrane protein 1, HAAT family [Rhizobiales bacterium GAS188]
MNLLPFIASGLGIGAVYALSGVGLVLLFRATGVFNLAFGALGAVGAHLAWWLAERIDLSLACLCGIAATTVLSFLYGRLIAPLVAYRDMVVRCVATLGLALILLGAMGYVWGETPRRLSFPTDRLYVDLFGTRLTYTRLIALLLALATVSGVTLIMARTRLGLAMRALANDRDLSALIGIRIIEVETAAWLITGVFAGFSGLLLGNLVRLQGQLLTFLIVPAIAAAILGRLRSLSLTAAAGIAIGVVEAMLSAVPEIAPFRSAAPFVIALIAVALQGASGTSLTSNA